MATSGGRKLVALLIAESSVLRRLHLGMLDSTQSGLRLSLNSDPV
jgi:hypothetical protein